VLGELVSDQAASMASLAWPSTVTRTSRARSHSVAP
jgi:hypothetical protein